MIDARKHYQPTEGPTLIEKASLICGSKSELAGRIGMSPQYLSAIIGGRKTMSYGMQVMLECIIRDAE